MKQYHTWKLDKDNLKDSPVSCSFLKAFAPNPYEWLMSPPFKQTEAMKTGSILDAAITDPKDLDAVLNKIYGIPKDIVIAPFKEFRTNESKEWKKEADRNGLDYLSENEAERIKSDAVSMIEEKKAWATKAAQQVFQHPIAGEILDGAQFQVGIIGKLDGINVKCLLDILPKEKGIWGDCLVDYKTTGNGLDDESLAQTIGKLKYGWQATWYLGLANKFHSRKFKRFAFIWQSTKTLEVRVTVLDQGSIALLDGDRCIAKALAEFKGCAEFGIRSNYLHTTDKVDIKPYHAMPEQGLEESE